MYQEKLFTSYLHLNASFSDNIGIANGKAGAVLYLSSVQDEYYREEISFIFLEEILSQISQHTPLNFADGIAGVGCLLEYLSRTGVMQIEVNQVVEDFEPYLLKTIKADLCADLTLGNGLSGYGLYLLSRLWSGNLSASDRARISGSLIYLVEQITKSSEAFGLLLGNNSLWDGAPGVYLFLSGVAAAGFLPAELMPGVFHILSSMIQNISSREMNWREVPLWFVLLNCRSGLLANSGYAEKIAVDFAKYCDWCIVSKVNVNFKEAIFYAALLRYTHHFRGISACQQVYDRLIEFALSKFERYALPSLFPYDAGRRSVRIGMAGGADGTALSLRAALEGEFRWLGILGY
ncbi:hypothetical protein SAMN05216327_118146 [Dyadobacter sp. SG02]|uniref:hypothetical protein n=1 Tax=Dyadobacter sp. SG02 TaxID=1855291 RepID=UPI0008CE4574|nr:hypothetical protein [Dyadobacter sp. SG02]SEJ75829.1 hypothetical protein SAMN05216327_118146 [Dyadobacter sp. SG02]